MQQHIDEELLAELKAGSEWAFGEIYRRYYTPLRLEAFYRLRDDQDAEDTVHDVFTSIWLRKESLPNIAFDKYLFQAVRNKCIDRIRRQQTMQQYVDHTKEDPEPCTRLIPIENEELSYQLQTAISGLPATQRTTFGLSFIEDKTNRQISEELGTSIQTVKNNLSTALRTLRKKLINLHNA